MSWVAMRVLNTRDRGDAANRRARPRRLVIEETEIDPEALGGPTATENQQG